MIRSGSVRLLRETSAAGRCYTSRRSKSTFETAMDAVTRLVTPASWLNRSPTFLVSDEMKTLSKNIARLIGSGHPVLNRVTSYYFDSGGKKVRPMLVLLLSRALSEIPLDQRDRMRIDYTDVPEDPVYSQVPKSILFEHPVNNISPLHILHGIKPLNPLTKGPEPLPQEFDRERGILPKQRRLAEIVEMIHTASLLHDDVIDHSGTRRGKPSGNVAFTNKMAVLAGDFLLGRATVSISRLRNPEVVELVSNCIANLVEGEFMQLKNTVVDGDLETINNGTQQIPPASKTIPLPVHDYRVNTTLASGISHEVMIETAFDYYLHKTYLKTAALISKSCRAAAVLSGARDPILDECYHFGKNLGICFQLVDDMLDFTTSGELGKPVGADFELGIATAPVLFAWKEDPSLGPIIQRNFSQPGDVARALEAVHQHDGIKKTAEVAREYRDKALHNLRAALPESDSRAALEFLTNSILTRRK
ncbi:AER004Wp [Eremothecium gossypii ATCC 10895]|uniref:AER004Wp n=1 Tax=Eremothecium gossypii (strain ATCC 10895 / CBS 109.51 / FGSC 9923 / NRRL Y-1056) TaxID=284811 RepID=Q757K8_EREGS|nr:AER004Wp [Eremothecium gossypii ATCC 10895]AAS52688.2 AER004Wp [Eremothecium gossypii ATCC 10895]AEY96993.1 FAER004Wp [Eremothecium gossypii FDAG1]